MQKLITLISFLTLFSSIFGQENQVSNTSQVKYVYSYSTTNSYNEICDLFHDDKNKLKEAKLLYKKTKESGKIILSTLEFKPISERIKAFENNKTNNIEEGNYIKRVKEKYFLVTDLIEK